MTRSIPHSIGCTLIGLFVFIAPIAAQEKPEKEAKPKTDPAVLTVDRIFDSKDFEPEKTPALRWRKRGSGYVTLEKAPGGQQLVTHDPATGRKETLDVEPVYEEMTGRVGKTILDEFEKEVKSVTN